jgi:hypothetical protein
MRSLERAKPTPSLVLEVISALHNRPKCALSLLHSPVLTDYNREKGVSKS